MDRQDAPVQGLLLSARERKENASPTHLNKYYYSFSIIFP